MRTDFSQRDPSVFPRNGYRLPGYAHTPAALYIPEYHHIWSNPVSEKSGKKDVIWEEISHSLQTSLHPSELLPFRNSLTGTSDQPGHSEFRDIIEAVYFATYPVAVDDPIDPEHPPEVYSPYRELGIQILKESARLAKFSAHLSASQISRKKVLWALNTLLYRVVPFAPNQGPRILSVIHDFNPDKWEGTKDLLVKLNAHMVSHLLQKQDSNEELTFTVMSPNDPHELLLKCVQIVRDFVGAPFHKQVRTVPVFLSALTLGLYHKIYYFQLRSHTNEVHGQLEELSLVEDNIAAASKVLREEGISLVPPVDRDLCPAYYIYANLLVFLRKLQARKNKVSYPYMVHEVLEVLIYLLRNSLFPALEEDTACITCRSTFRNEQFQENARNVASLSGPKKTQLIGTVAKYGSWLQDACLDEIRRAFELEKPVHVASNLHSNNGTTSPESGAESSSFVRSIAYRFPAPESEEWAKFLPALGQIWILPDCREELISLIRTHEIQHARLTTLGPSQCLPLTHALLGRRMPRPERFRDIVEAGYVLGLTIGSGYPPEEQYFPPAPERDKRLARALSRVAWDMAETADPAVDRTEAAREAAKALIFFTHQVVLPHREGIGESFITCLKQLAPPEPWKNASELRPQLFVELQEVAGKEQPFHLMLPPDPHRLVVDMLNFLALALQPIPEREKSVLRTFPVLLNILMFGSLGCVPLIDIKEEGGRYRAEISVLHTEPVKERDIHASLRTHAAEASNGGYGKGCKCTWYWANILGKTKESRGSPNSGRLYACVSSVLENTHLESFRAADFDCPACEYHLNHQEVRDNLDAIQITWKENHQRIGRAARRYEEWLVSDCMELIANDLALGKPVSPVKSYEYL